MKNKILLSLLALFSLATLPALADSMESVRVIKFWDDTDDLVVERESGERMLIQHNRACMTMSTEFPMKLVWDEGEIVQAKVAANELCDVYNTGPYSSELTILKRIPSINAMVAEHEAEVLWDKARYYIDYGEGCRYIRDYVGETAYLYTPEGDLEGATLYLPKARGQCEILGANLLEEMPPESTITESPIKNLKFKAENNQAFFSWDEFPEDETWLVLVAHSKYQLDPDEYELSQMPDLRRSRYNYMRVYQLMNDQPYYFYITASNSKGELAPWQKLKITPVQTARRFINDPDPDPFEIEMTEDDEAYHLVWPDKAEHSSRYLIMVFVDGKRQILELIDGTENEYDLAKQPEWSRSRFRMTVRSIPKKPIGLKFFDSIFWRKG